MVTTTTAARPSAAGLAEVWGAEPAGTLHLTLNPVIDADPASPTTAVARSVLLIIAPGTPPALVGSARITQYLRGGADGWRITRRSVEQ
jgi:SnoaL-like domain